MKLTVADIMQMPPLSSGEVVAGFGGLANTVTNISVLEVPHRTDLIEPGQLEISAFYAIADSEEVQLQVLKQLHECGASGLILAHMDYYLKKIPDSLKDLCNQLNFPLILIPDTIAYIDIISVILDNLPEKKTKQLQSKIEIFDKMRDLVLEEKDCGRIVSELSYMIKRQVVFYSHNYIRLAHSHAKPAREVDAQMEGHIKNALPALMKNNGNVQLSPSDRPGARLLLCPIASTIAYYGTMVIFDAADMDSLSEIAIAQAKSALGITTLNKINLKDHKNILSKKFINDLLNWNFSDEMSAAAVGETFGLDVSKVKICAVFGIQDGRQNRADAVFQKNKFQLLDCVKHEINLLSAESIVADIGNKIVLLFSTEKRPEEAYKHLNHHCLRLIDKMEKATGLHISAGLGSYCKSVSAIHRSYQDALFALRVSRNAYGTRPCVHHSEFQLFSLIHDSLAADKIHAAADELFAPVTAYDAEHNTQLFSTFAMLIQNSLNTALVAEKMFLHKNTVLQRKKKILELYPYDPFVMPNYLNFECALVLKQILQD